MVPDIPLSLYYSFLVLSVGTFIIVVREVRRTYPDKRSYIYGLTLWFFGQYLGGKLGFFATGIGELPPRIMLIVVPNFLFIFFLAFSATGKSLAKHWNILFLTAVQSFRIGVEFILWQLAGRELLPEVMSVEGRNLDVLVGVTAPIAAYLYAKGKISEQHLIFWNIAGLLLLTNVVVHGMLSVSGIEAISTNIPNFIISYAPFNLLPGVLVPIAYGMHVLSIRKLLNK